MQFEEFLRMGDELMQSFKKSLNNRQDGVLTRDFRELVKSYAKITENVAMMDYIPEFVDTIGKEQALSVHNLRIDMEHVDITQLSVYRNYFSEHLNLPFITLNKARGYAVLTGDSEIIRRINVANIIFYNTPPIVALRFHDVGYAICPNGDRVFLDELCARFKNQGF